MVEVNRRSFVAGMAAISAAPAILAAPAITAAPAWAQSYPQRPIKLIVPYAPGGGTLLGAVVAAEAAASIGPVLEGLRLAGRRNRPVVTNPPTH